MSVKSLSCCGDEPLGINSRHEPVDWDPERHACVGINEPLTPLNLGSPVSNYIKSRLKEEWGDSQERQLDLWSKKAERRAILHQAKSNRLNLLKHFFNLPVLFISSVLVFLNGISEEKYKTVNIGLNFAITCLSAVSLKFNFEKKSIEHMNSSQRYLQLTEIINSQLSKPREHRRDVAEFSGEIRSQYIHLVRTSSPMDIEKVEAGLN